MDRIVNIEAKLELNDSDEPIEFEEPKKTQSNVSAQVDASVLPDTMQSLAHDHT